MSDTDNTELSFQQNILSIQSEFSSINETYSKNMSDLTKAIKFSNFDTDEIKEKLLAFAHEQKRIAEAESFGERMVKKASRLPLIGSYIDGKASEMREQRLSEETVSGLVGQMFNGLKKQAEEVEVTEQSLIKIQKETQSNIESMQDLSEKISAMMDSGEVPPEYHTQTLKMSTHVKIMVEKSLDKVENLKVVIPTTRGILEMIYQRLPISHADLLTDIAMGSGIDQINKLFSDTKEMSQLANEISTSMMERNQTALLNLVNQDAITDDEMLEIENNAKRRQEMYLTTMQAVKKRDERALISAKKIDEIAKSTAEQRLMISGPRVPEAPETQAVHP